MQSFKKTFSVFKLFSVVMILSIILTGCTVKQGEKGEHGERGKQGVAGKELLVLLRTITKHIITVSKNTNKRLKDKDYQMIS